MLVDLDHHYTWWWVARVNQRETTQCLPAAALNKPFLQSVRPRQCCNVSGSEVDEVVEAGRGLTKSRCRIHWDWEEATYLNLSEGK